MVLYGVLEKFRVGFQAKGLHDSVLVEGDSSRFQVQDAGDFLHRSAFRKQL